MLPIVAVGLTPASTPLARRIADDRPLFEFTDVESASFALQDGATVVIEPGVRRGVDWKSPRATGDVADMARDSAGWLAGLGITTGPVTGWICHVLYGEGAFPAAQIARPATLAHTGLTMALIDSAGDDPTTPRRVIDGQEQWLTDRRTVWQAVTMLGVKYALVVPDVTEAGVTALRGLLDDVELAMGGVDAS
jgi:hypothetical protein